MLKFLVLDKQSDALLQCPYHPDAPLIDDDHAGNQICWECGLVVGDRLELESSFVVYKSRIGAMSVRFSLIKL